MSNTKDPVDRAAAIMRRHLAAELREKGEVKLGLQSATMTTETIQYSFPEWTIKSIQEIYRLFGEKKGHQYLSEAIKIIWKENGAWKEIH